MHHYEKLAALLQVLAQLHVELAYTSLAAVVDAGDLGRRGLSLRAAMSPAEALAIVDGAPDVLEAATGGGVVLHLRRERRPRYGRAVEGAPTDVTRADVVGYARAVGFAREGLTVRDDLPDALAAYLPPPRSGAGGAGEDGPPVGLLLPALTRALPRVALRPALAFGSPSRRAASEALLRWARDAWAAPLFGAELRALAAEGGRLELRAPSAGGFDRERCVAFRAAVDADLARFGVRALAFDPVAPGTTGLVFRGPLRRLRRLGAGNPAGAPPHQT